MNRRDLLVSLLSLLKSNDADRVCQPPLPLTPPMPMPNPKARASQPRFNSSTLFLFFLHRSLISPLPVRLLATLPVPRLGFPATRRCRLPPSPGRAAAVARMPGVMLAVAAADLAGAHAEVGGRRARARTRHWDTVLLPRSRAYRRQATTPVLLPHASRWRGE
jgi:hypothetical protein